MFLRRRHAARVSSVDRDHSVRRAAVNRRLRSGASRAAAGLALMLVTLSACELIGGYEDFHSRHADAGLPEAGATQADASDSSAEAGEDCLNQNTCLYVDSVNGNDYKNDGSKPAPFKTYAKAMSAAVLRQTVYFEPGTYSADSDNFTIPIPLGVTLRRAPDARDGEVIFLGGDTDSLVFTKDGTVSQIHLVGFANPFTATIGTQALSDVQITDPKGPVLVQGSAAFSCDGCTVRGRSAGFSVVQNASLTLSNTRLNSTAQPWTLNQPCTPRTDPRVAPVSAADSAAVTLINFELEDGHDAHMSLFTNGAIVLRGVRLGFSCSGYGMLSGPTNAPGRESSLVDISDSKFLSEVYVEGTSNVKIRNSEFSFLGLFPRGIGEGLYDLGMSLAVNGVADPGSNSFKGGTSNPFYPGLTIYVATGNFVVFASGNDWIANEQGADEYGHYPVGSAFSTVKGDAGTGLPMTGRNFTVVGTGILLF